MKLWQLASPPGTVQGDASHELQNFLVASTNQRSCKKIFIDMGANLGMHARFLLEPERYPAERYMALFKMQEIFDTYFGRAIERTRESQHSGVCVFGFEANPAQAERLEHLNQCYRRKGWKVNYTIAAVWNGVEKHIFIKHGNGIGFGTGSHIVKTGGVQVSTVDIVTFLNNLQTTYQPEIIVGKMDIEGAEYTVLPALEKAGLLCSDNPGAFTAVTFEFHGKQKATYKVPKTFPCVADTQFIALDSEDYVRDGQDLCGTNNVY